MTPPRLSVFIGFQWVLSYALGTGLMGTPLPARAAPPAKPNLLVILTDQQHAGMLSCAGNRYVKTPAMDSLAAAGARFERAYSANPVCVPSRVSMMTGHLPSRFGMQSNAEGRKEIPAEYLKQSLGWVLRGAGYRTVYGGKTHWFRNMNPQSIGFESLTRDERDELAEACARFLGEKHDKPFLLVASFINPHDICYMAIDDHARALGKPPLYPQSRVERQTLAKALRLPEGVSREAFFQNLCPPPPANLDVPALEPECLQRQYVGTGTFREHARNNWSDETWRMHRWAYCRLTEMVDAQIGRVLDALRRAGLEERTVIVFTSDHGDMDGAHRLEHKSVLYEESVRIPFIVSCKGVTRPGLVDTTHLVSNGLDLIPTLCDYAGIQAPAGLAGRSARALAEGRTPPSWRDEVVAESHAGRMLRTARYKYNLYESGQHREQLIDLVKDPGEMLNLAEDPKLQPVLAEHRRRLRRWVQSTEDKFAQRYLPAGEK